VKVPVAFAPLVFQIKEAYTAYLQALLRDSNRPPTKRRARLEILCHQLLKERHITILKANNLKAAGPATRIMARKADAIVTAIHNLARVIAATYVLLLRSIFDSDSDASCF
jgi:hypothetical protein